MTIHPVLGELDYLPLVTSQSLRVPSVSDRQTMLDRIAVIRQLRDKTEVQTIGFTKLWRAAVPGRDEPRFDSTDGRLLDEPDEDLAGSAGMIVHAFHDLGVGTRVIEYLRAKEPTQTHATTALEVLERGIEGLTDIAARRTAVANLVKGAVDLSKIVLPEPTKRLLNSTNTEILKGNGASPSNVLADLAMQQEDDVDPTLLQTWQTSLALRIISRLEAVGTELDSDLALDFTARAHGWFTSALDSLWRTLLPREWTVVSWSELIRSESAAFRGVAAAVLNDTSALRNVCRELAIRQEGLPWLDSRLSRLEGMNFPSICLLQPQAILSRWLPSRRYALRVITQQPAENPVAAGAYLVFTDVAPESLPHYDPRRYVFVVPRSTEQPLDRPNTLVVRDPGGLMTRSG